MSIKIEDANFPTCKEIIIIIILISIIKIMTMGI